MADWSVDGVGLHPATQTQMRQSQNHPAVENQLDNLVQRRFRCFDNGMGLVRRRSTAGDVGCRRRDTIRNFPRPEEDFPDARPLAKPGNLDNRDKSAFSSSDDSSPVGEARAAPGLPRGGCGTTRSRWISSDLVDPWTELLLPEAAMSAWNRRHFLSAASGLTLGSGLTSSLLAQEEKAQTEAEPQPKPEPVRLALMGVNGRGRQLMSVLARFPEAEIAWICDPDTQTWDPAVKQWTEAGRPAPQTTQDFRKALDDKSVDVLVCAAPDHWHALATVWACQAGKDVYVEKPCCHNPVEGRRMIEAARKYQRVVQVGTQRRSAPDMQALAEYLQSGKLGQVKFVRTWITSVRPSIGKVAVTAPPEHLDYSLWAGPGPDGGYKSNLVHYHWHWRWDFGTGECGNNGIHALDVARWGTGVDAPTRVSCGGGRYYFEDDQETPDTQLATFEFPDLCIQWEHRTWSPRGLDGETFGVEFYGTEGTLLTNGRGWTVYDPKNAVVQKVEPGESDANHWRNFFDCLKTRSLPNADIEINHKSTMFCHLANIAWRTGSVVNYDGATETISNNPAASALLGRQYRKGFELPVL